MAMYDECMVRIANAALAYFCEQRPDTYQIRLWMAHLLNWCS